MAAHDRLAFNSPVKRLLRRQQCSSADTHVSATRSHPPCHHRTAFSAKICVLRKHRTTRDVQHIVVLERSTTNVGTAKLRHHAARCPRVGTQQNNEGHFADLRTATRMVGRSNRARRARTRSASAASAALLLLLWLLITRMINKIARCG
jgi:hypothetical protein